MPHQIAVPLRHRAAMRLMRTTRVYGTRSHNMHMPVRACTTICMACAGATHIIEARTLDTRVAGTWCGLRDLNNYSPHTDRDECGLARARMHTM